MTREGPLSQTFPHIRVPWMAIAAEHRDAIAKGDLAPGDPVGPAAALAVMYRVERKTALKALRALAAEGLIEQRPGRGFFVPGGRPGPAVRAEAVARQRAMSSGCLEDQDPGGDRAPINPRGRLFVYEVAAGRIEKRIRSGEFGDEGRLPTIKHLAGWYGVSEPSVRRALRSLQERGVVCMLPSKGTFTVPAPEAGP